MLSYSVLISVYNKERPEYLRQALDSMFNQTVPPDEIVLVCDGPLNSSLEQLIQRYQQQYASRFQVLRLESNEGLGPALNRGISVCRNEWIARMDSDDISVSDRIEKQMAYLESHPEVSVVGGQITEFTDDPARPVDMRCVPLDVAEIRRTLRFKNPMNHVTVLFRKSHVLAVGSYEDYPRFEDYQLWAKLLLAGYEMGNIPDSCCYVRAGSEAFRRRGGISYFRYAMAMQNFLLGHKLICTIHYLRNMCIWFAASVMPNGMRSFLMKKVMRKRAEA